MIATRAASMALGKRTPKNARSSRYRLSSPSLTRSRPAIAP